MKLKTFLEYVTLFENGVYRPGANSESSTTHKELHQTLLQHGFKHTGSSLPYAHSQDKDRMRVRHEYEHPQRGDTVNVIADKGGKRAHYVHTSHDNETGRTPNDFNKHWDKITG